MTKVVGVRFKDTGKTYYFDPGKLECKKGQTLIVETSKGIESGVAQYDVKEISDDEVVSPLKPVKRIATEEDLKTIEKNKADEKKALLVCAEKIEKHNLEMNLTDAEYSFDRSKIVFYFTADGRVDFRELVKDLATHFHTRIELRQIGVRDESRLLGGLGICGRPFCCSTFLDDFHSVSIISSSASFSSSSQVLFMYFLHWLFRISRTTDRSSAVSSIPYIHSLSSASELTTVKVMLLSS